MKLDFILIARIVVACTLFICTASVLTGQRFLGLNYAECCFLTGLFWLACVCADLEEFIAEYMDTRKQRRLKFGILLGSSCTILGCEAQIALGHLCEAQIALGYLYTATLLAWAQIVFIAMKTRNQYIKIERGLVHKDTWVCPPVEAFRAGDIFGSTGVWWEPCGLSFAHCEIVSTDIGSDTTLASSCAMEVGTYTHSLADALRNCRTQTHLREGYEKWFCARLTPAGERDLQKAAGGDWRSILMETIEQQEKVNTSAHQRENSRRRKLIFGMPFISEPQKRYLSSRWQATGYNWTKLLFAEADQLMLDLRKWLPSIAWLLFGEGEVDESHLCSTYALSIFTNKLGLGAYAKSNQHRSYLPYGLANPVLPMELIFLKSRNNEPYFRLLNIDDKRAFEARHATKQISKA